MVIGGSTYYVEAYPGKSNLPKLRIGLDAQATEALCVMGLVLCIVPMALDKIPISL